MSRILLKMTNVVRQVVERLFDRWSETAVKKSHPCNSRMAQLPNYPIIGLLPVFNHLLDAADKIIGRFAIQDAGVEGEADVG
jgi:hypothetical protein